MRQRNDSGSALHVSAWPTEDDPDRRPFDVAIGEEIDFPELLAGLTSLEAPQPDVPAAADSPGPDAADAEPAAKSKARAKTPAAAQTPEGGEPR